MEQKRKYRPKLPDFLSLCERNFAQLHPLLPATLAEGQQLVIGLDDDHYYQIDVLEVCPFTTVVQIQALHDPLWSVTQPTFDVRLYHDARLAEVIRCHGVRNFKAVYDYPNTDMLQPDEKRQVNRLLSDWLSLCHQQGFRAEPIFS